jgi:hypothetical protein
MAASTAAAMAAAAGTNDEGELRQAGIVFMTADQMPQVPMQTLEVSLLASWWYICVLCVFAENCMCVLIAIQGCTLLADGQLLAPDNSLRGWVQPDGVLISPEGMALGRMPDAAALEMWEQGARMMEQQSAERSAAAAAAAAQSEAEAARLRDSVPDWGSEAHQANPKAQEQVHELLTLPPVALIAESNDAMQDGEERKHDDDDSKEGDAAQPALSRALTLRRSSSTFDMRTADRVEDIQIEEAVMHDDADDDSAAGASSSSRSYILQLVSSLCSLFLHLYDIYQKVFRWTPLWLRAWRWRENASPLSAILFHCDSLTDRRAAAMLCRRTNSSPALTCLWRSVYS